MASKTIICLDAGHGGSDPGAVGNGLREDQIAFDVTNQLAEKLKNAGFDVVLSRPSANINPGINARWQLANEKKANYFISIHVNAGGGTGEETLFYKENSERSRRSEEFANCVNSIYAQEMGLRNRGVKTDTQSHLGSIGVLRYTNMPAILVELAFIDSPLHNPDVPILRDKRQEIATALAKAITNCLGGTPAEPEPEPTKPAVAIDILGKVKNISGYIENGATWVRLTEFSEALGYSAVWDDTRRIPVIKK